MININVCDISLYNLIFYFFIYSFLGWVMEVSYATLDTGKFINRGFLNGPVCPIYGVGCICIILSLTPLIDNLFYLFTGSVILTSLLEFITGAVLEKIFHTKWWDYSEYPFNIKGYICLKFSITWGIACIIVMRIIQPLITVLVSIFPLFWGYILLAIFMISIIIDMSFTVRTILKLHYNFAEAEIIVKKIRIASDNLGEAISEETLELKRKYDVLLESRELARSRLLKAFPKLKEKISIEEFRNKRNK